jgi:hypothetical protein
MEVPSEACWKMCIRQLSHSFEPQHGGFGEAPKFPQPVNLNFLFHVYSREPTSETGKRALDMCLHTLKMMAKGGIHDHVSQVRLKQVFHDFQGCMSQVGLFCVLQPFLVKVKIPQYGPFPLPACYTVLLIMKLFTVHHCNTKLTEARCVVKQ